LQYSHFARWVERTASLILILILVSGCQARAAGKPIEWNGGATETAAATLKTLAPTAPAGETPQAARPSATPESLAVFVYPDLPEGYAGQLSLPTAVRVTDSISASNLSIHIAGEKTAQSARVTTSTWVYALVTPFATVQDEVHLADLQQIWNGGSKQGIAQRLLMTKTTLAVFEQFWGPVAPFTVQVAEKEDLLDIAWTDIPPFALPTPTVPGMEPQPTPQPALPTLAIIPFEEIEPRWKVLRVEDQSPLEAGFDPAAYPLAVKVALTLDPDTALDEAALKTLAESVRMPTNYDPSKLTSVVLTGTTAISRHIAARMEEKGVTYPGEAIRDWLANADLTHISNEVSFYTDCPKAGPDRADMRFCSHPKYIELLEYVGADIIELTGNHNLDWGFQPFLDSLKMYEERGWKTYGGGANLDQAKQPLLLEHNGNRLAFIGCSPSGPEAVWATKNTPGSAPCDMTKLEQQVSQLRAEGYLPIVTFQAGETDLYRPAIAQGMPDFRRMARAGAVVVSGSQSHVPQTMTFVQNGSSPEVGFVHYGLGNLFFDQMSPPETREEFIDRHVFYNGRYLGVQLYTALLEDYSQPRPMENQERRGFLQKIFTLCDWNEK